MERISCILWSSESLWSVSAEQVVTSPPNEKNLDAPTDRSSHLLFLISGMTSRLWPSLSTTMFLLFSEKSTPEKADASPVISDIDARSLSMLSGDVL